MIGYVYRIIFEGGFTYVGSTTQPVNNRISGHITALKRNSHSVECLRPFFEKYGVTSDNGGQTFNCANIISVEFECKDRKHLRRLEQQYMNTIPSDKLINIRRSDNWRYIEHDFMSIPVNCDVWADMLFPVLKK